MKLAGTAMAVALALGLSAALAPAGLEDKQ